MGPWRCRMSLRNLEHRFQPGSDAVPSSERSEPDLKVLREALQLGAAAGPPVVIGVAANGPHGPAAAAPHA